MAKTAWINRNERKRTTVKKYAALRAELKAKKDYAGLTQLPRDASPTRVVNRCEVSGRRRAFIRRFKVSRLTFRELASQGLIPGVTKSSWELRPQSGRAGCASRRPTLSLFLSSFASVAATENIADHSDSPGILFGKIAAILALVGL